MKIEGKSKERERVDAINRSLGGLVFPFSNSRPCAAQA